MKKYKNLQKHLVFHSVLKHDNVKQIKTLFLKSKTVSSVKQINKKCLLSYEKIVISSTCIYNLYKRHI